MTGFPSSGPFVTTRMWCEGWQEDITAKSWFLTVFASDYATTGPPGRWVDVAPGPRWLDVDPLLTWAGAASWDPDPFGLNAGRWADTASDLA